MSDTGKLYRDASMLAMRKKQVNRLQQEVETVRNQTIEECALEIERWEKDVSLSYQDLIDRIRAKKNKP